VLSGTAWHGIHGPFLVVLLVVGAIWLAAEVRQSLNRRAEATVADAGSRAVMAVTRIPGIILAIVAIRAVSGATIRPQVLAESLAVVIFSAGAVLRLWSFHTLGRYFTFVVQTSSDQPVISSGPYRVLRHPSYTGILLVIAGLGFSMGNWLSVLSLTVSGLIGLLYRISVEEKALENQLGERYREFAATRKRVIPFVW
jgi:protein-S-isoprenylcysteine O-methyltransferase Ste14